VIAIVDYGSGNLCSVRNALAEIGVEGNLARDGRELRRATKIVLPGVGHFGQLASALDRRDLRQTLFERISAGVPFLGICLGLQALFQGSEEAVGGKGLGIFSSSARRFPSDLRVPHMGWSPVVKRRPSRLLANFRDGSHAYFAHSYYAPECEATAATCSYGVSYTAVLERGNLFGVQFHPEKSGPVGLSILRNFVEL
jgi:glutamine amidotransferase